MPSPKIIATLLVAVVVLVAVGGVVYYHYFAEREEQPVETPKGEEVEPVLLRIGILPVIDALPYHIAVSESLDAKRGLDLEVTVFRSARERDEAYMAGQLDAIMTDLVGALLLKNRGYNLTVILSKHATFYLVVSPALSQQVTSIEDLGVHVKSIAISRATVIEFALHKMLTAGRLDPARFEIHDIRVITERFVAVLEGRVDAAVLPEPWGPLAQTKGARIVCSITLPIVVLSVTEGKLTPKQIENLGETIIEAFQLYRDNTEKYRVILEDRARIGVPSEFAGWWIPRDLVRQDYIIKGVDSTLFNEVVSWMLAEGMITRAFTEAELVYQWSRTT